MEIPSFLTCSDSYSRHRRKKEEKEDEGVLFLDMLPGMIESVKEAANAHKKAVAKWHNISDSD
jgi:hypothetical protein